MKNTEKTGVVKNLVQEGMAVARMAAIWTFAILFCIVFVVVRIIYSLANWVVKKLEKAGYL